MHFLTPLFNTDVFFGTFNTTETLKQEAEESASRIIKTYKQVGFVKSSTDCGETVGALLDMPDIRCMKLSPLSDGPLVAEQLLQQTLLFHEIRTLCS
jgi:hypothetical protein